MQNFTKEESNALLYLKLARDLGANDISINKSTCEVIINLVERLMQKPNGSWISIEDRLPDNDDRLLVLYRNFELKYNITYIDSYNGYGKWEELEKLKKEYDFTREYIHDNGLEWDLLSK